MQTYHYQVSVTDGSGARKIIVGTVEALKGDLPTATSSAMKAAFEKLVGPTQTVENCGGPFTIDRLELTRATGRLESCNG